MAETGELDPKRRTRQELARSSVQLINRLAQAFPGFFDGYQVADLELKFSEPVCNESQRGVSTVYEDTRLVGIIINPRLLTKLYEELDEVSYAELVRINVGIAVCQDAVFQKLLRDMSDSRITEHIHDFLMDIHSVPRALEDVFASDVAKMSVDRAWMSAITKNGYIDEDLVAHINSQRLAIGMIVAAEQEKFGAAETNGVIEAVRGSILHEFNRKARTMRAVGYAMTGNLGVAIDGAARSILDPDLIPYAIPYSIEELQKLTAGMSKASRSYELPYDDALILEISEGYPARDDRATM